MTGDASVLLGDAAATLAVLSNDPAVGRAVERIGALLRDSLAAGGTVLFCGNGGSAAEASHLAAELSGRLMADRPALAGVSLASDLAAVTAIANDYGYEQVFTRQVEALGRPGDVLVVLTTSGTSPNVVAAAERAKALGVSVVALVGPASCPLDDVADETVHAPGSTSGAIQVGHLALGHAILALAEAAAHTPS